MLFVDAESFFLGKLAPKNNDFLGSQKNRVVFFLQHRFFLAKRKKTFVRLKVIFVKRCWKELPPKKRTEKFWFSISFQSKHHPKVNWCRLS